MVKTKSAFHGWVFQLYVAKIYHLKLDQLFLLNSSNCIYIFHSHFIHINIPNVTFICRTTSVSTRGLRSVLAKLLDLMRRFRICKFKNRPLSFGQMWFLSTYFPLIGGMFLLRSGLRFSFRAPEVSEPRVRKRPPFTKMAFSSLSVPALPVPKMKI